MVWRRWQADATRRAAIVAVRQAQNDPAQIAEVLRRAALCCMAARPLPGCRGSIGYDFSKRPTPRLLMTHWDKPCCQCLIVRRRVTRHWRAWRWSGWADSARGGLDQFRTSPCAAAAPALFDLALCTRASATHPSAAHLPVSSRDLRYRDDLKIGRGRDVRRTVADWSGQFDLAIAGPGFGATTTAGRSDHPNPFRT